MRHPRFRAALMAFALGIAVSSPGYAAPPVPPPVVLTPVQAAFIQAETRRIEESFGQKVMSITGARREQMLRAIPANGAADRKVCPDLQFAGAGSWLSAQ